MTQAVATAGTRRSMLQAACRHCIGMAALFGASARAQEAAPAAAPAPAAVPPVERFTRPAADTDEGGLWALMDREESRLRRSPFIMRDAALARYVQELACALSAGHCPDIRVHVVRTPLFNASMAPNGMMQVWTGLLLRVENEAQLAAVLGHEIGHYLERHTLERMRDAKSRAAFAQFIGMFGIVGAIGQIGAVAGMFAFSRDQELRADRLGMKLMRDAGYDGREAARIWTHLLEEAQVTGGTDVGRRTPMMATHPPIENRRDELLSLAGNTGGKVGGGEFGKVIAPHRMEWLHEELRRGQYEESLALFDRMLRDRPDDVQARYARGEAYRRRAADKDLDRAVQDLEQATLADKAPPEAFRSLGLVHRQRANPDGALRAFETYLGAAPQAADAGLIKTYITQLKP
jgi:predicted Zn-dependent protease